MFRCGNRRDASELDERIYANGKMPKQTETRSREELSEDVMLPVYRACATENPLRASEQEDAIPRALAERSGGVAARRQGWGCEDFRPRGRDASAVSDPAATSEQRRRKGAGLRP